MQQKLSNRILLVLEETPIIEGTKHLAYETLGVHNMRHVRKILSRFESQDEINITRHGPGRGHKNIIRRNRNSPGSKRRTVNEKLQSRSIHAQAEGVDRPGVFYLLRLWHRRPDLLAAYRADKLLHLLRVVLEQER